MRPVVPLLLAAALVAPAAATPPAPLAPKPTLKSVAHLQWNGGTDLEMTRIGGRRYVVQGAQNNYNSTTSPGLRVIDVTTPTKPKVAGFLPCNTSQNDIQIQGHLAFVAVDFNERSSSFENDCFSQLGMGPKTGVVVVDIAVPAKPRAIGFLALKTGAHNTTVYPTKPLLYISESESLNPSADDPLEPVYVVDFANPRKPKLVKTFDLGAGDSAHDITFNKSGTRAYVAAGFTGDTFILDTSKPLEPKVLTRIPDAAVNFSHQADPTPDGHYLLITDELAGAEGNTYCPGGGIHVWDISNEAVPVKVGAYFIPDSFATADPGPRPNIVGVGPRIFRCTAHVMRMTPDGKTLVMAWYSQGVQVLDLTGLPGYSVGVQGADKGTGIRRLGSWTVDGADTWSAKMDDRGYIYTGDTQRGFDVVRFVRPSGAAKDPGTWLTPQQALFRGLRDKAHQPARTYFCYERLTRLGL